MNVLIVNPIVYTSETKNITRAKSIKDTMIYDLCLAFRELGHSVMLYAAEPFSPIETEDYPFDVIWGKCVLRHVCFPNCFPYMPSLLTYIKRHYDEIDLIICSEVFSLNTLGAVLCANEKVVIWHELAKHNAMMKKIPSKIWYNIVARLFMHKTKVIARSEDAKNFISQYCNRTEDFVIDHGVNLHKFQVTRDKKNHFIVCSQLITRKRIDGILRHFKDYLTYVDSTSQLYIVGDGDKKDELMQLANSLEISGNTIFMGKLSHEKMLPYLATAKALLINTEKDNSMISIVEAIAVGTPVVTTKVPLNSEYIKAYRLGIASEWNWRDLEEIVRSNVDYVENCIEYRQRLSTVFKARQFENIKGGNESGT